MTRIDLPVDEKTIRKLKLGEDVELYGTVVTARDAAELARKDAEELSTFLGNVFESPDATRLTTYQKHHVLVTRMDFPASRGRLTSLRVTDIHFPLIMMVSSIASETRRPFLNDLIKLVMIPMNWMFVDLFAPILSCTAKNHWKKWKKVTP